MSKTNIAKDTAEVTWLVVSAFGLALLIILGRLMIRDLRDFPKNLRRLFDAAKTRGKRRRIMRLMESCSDEDIYGIAYSLLAWPLEGLPDKDLFLPRPPHYKLRLKMGGALKGADRNSQAPYLVDLGKKGKSDLLAVIAEAIGSRSLSSLSWIEQCLESRSGPASSDTAS